jgi:DNA mismatch repair protein MSH5
MVFTTPADDLVGGPSHDQEESSNMGQQGRQMRMAGWIDLESRLSVSIPFSLLLLPIPFNVQHKSIILIQI